jgi:hypothetical protein
MKDAREWLDDWVVERLRTITAACVECRFGSFLFCLCVCVCVCGWVGVFFVHFTVLVVVRSVSVC